MKKIKLLVAVIACMALVLAITACGGKTPDEGAKNGTQAVDDSKGNGNTSTADAKEKSNAETNVSNTDTDTGETTDQNRDGSEKDTLVVVFSATGTTKGVAEKIASITDADLYEIIPAEPYSDADLNWNDKKSRTTKEQNDTSSRPAIGSEAISLEGYKTIFIGYPIWWGIEPRIMDTFVESYDFDGITLIPFCTSGSSGIGRSGRNLAELAGSGNWLDGGRLQGSASESDLRAWIEGFK